MNSKNRLLRAFPQITSLLQEPEINVFESCLAQIFINRLLKHTVSELKKEINSDSFAINDNFGLGIKKEIIKRFSISAHELTKNNYKRVMNLSGVMIHSNLGRSVLSPNSMKASVDCACGAVNLEMDMVSGKRIDRNIIVRKKLNFLFNSSDSLVVNNNAAALFLVCNTLSKGREIIVSRGELVEIGGSFRLHDIIESSGARIKEVGTTNRTEISDYEDAINSNTSMILKIHPSNFYMKGYVCETKLEKLGKLAAKKDLLLCYDMGTAVTGNFFKQRKYYPDKAFNDGAHLVTFSGDKLLCGPQSGIILGNTELIKSLHKNPIFRALRCCKITLSTLETIVSEYFLNPDKTTLTKVLSMPLDDIKETALKIKKYFIKHFPESYSFSIEAGHTLIGSGVSPEIKYDTYTLSIKSKMISATKISAKFRNHTIPVIGYISKEKFCLDCRMIDFKIPEVFNHDFFESFQ